MLFGVGDEDTRSEALSRAGMIDCEESSQGEVKNGLGIENGMQRPCGGKGRKRNAW